MNKKGHSVSTLAVLLLSCVFAGCLLLTLAYGVKAYRATAEQSTVSYEQRTALLYITQKIRAFDKHGTVQASTYADGDALRLLEESDGASYQTILYFYDGWLCELYAAAGVDAGPEYGEQLMEIQDLSVRKQDDTVYFTVTGTDGQTSSGMVQLRSGGAA